MCNSQYLVAGSVLAMVIALGAPLQAAIVSAGDNWPFDNSWWIDGGGSQDTYVGKNFFGIVTVDGGSKLKTGKAYMGHSQSAVGKVSVEGASSSWQVHGSLYVGYRGRADLRMTDGAVSVYYAYAYIGYSQSGAGKVTVDGPTSSWQVDRCLYVGYSGKGYLSPSPRR